MSGITIETCKQDTGFFLSSTYVILSYYLWMKSSIEHSNIDPALPVYEGQQYDHLRDVFREKTRQLKDSLSLNGILLPPYRGAETIGEREKMNRGSEQLEEKKLLSKDISKHSEQFTRFGISFEKLVIGPFSVDLNSFIPTTLQVGSRMVKTMQPFGNTKVSDALSFSDLGAVRPHVQHLIRLGYSLEYGVPFQIRKTNGF